MKQVRLEPMGAVQEVPTNERVLNALLAEKLEVPMACGGRGLCATCHVFVRKGAGNLSPATDREKRTLARVSGVQKESRLACQACVLGDGVVVECPEGMYVEKVSDLYVLVGRRAETPILHPIDGRTLIEKGKIITRSRLKELENVSFDLDDLMELKQASRNVLHDTRGA